MALSKPLLTAFGIHYRLESCVQFVSVLGLQDEIHEGYHHACAPCNMRFLTKNQLTNHNNRHHTIKTEQKDGTPKVKKEKGSGVGGGKTNKKYLYDKISQEVKCFII